MSQRFLFYKGRVALYALLKAFGISSGHRVLVPGYTCIVVPLAVRYLGAIPEYTDIQMQSYNATLENYKEAFARIESQGNAHTLKAVLVQHTYGNPNKDIASIVSWAQQKGLVVLEDCAHVNGIVINGKAAGNFGDGSFFSTQWSKPFTTGLGGIAQLNRETDEKVRDALVQLAQSAEAPGTIESCVLALQLLAHKVFLKPSLYWFAINTHRALSKAGIFVGSSTTAELNGEMPQDYFKKMGGLQIWLLAKRSANMEQVNRNRKRLVEEYDKLLNEKGFSTFKRESGAVLIRYPVRVEDKKLCLEDAKEQKIELGDWFDSPLHPAGSNVEDLNWDDHLCPNAVTLACDTINLPVHNGVDVLEARRIVAFISKYIKKTTLES